MNIENERQLAEIILSIYNMKNKSKQTDERIGRESHHLYSCVCPSVTWTFVSHSICIGKTNAKQMSSIVFCFRTSEHFQCDYFVSIIVEIQKIRSQEFQSTFDNHNLIHSFNIGPFRQKQLHHCRMSIIGVFHQGSVSILQDSRRGDR